MRLRRVLARGLAAQVFAARVLRGAQLVVALTLAGVLGVAAQSAPDGTGLVLGVLALAVALGGIGIALVPARGPLVASGPGTPSMLPPQPAAPWPTTEAGSAR